MLRVYIIVDLTTDEDDNSTELYMCGAGRDSLVPLPPLLYHWQDFDKQKNTLKSICPFLFSTLKGKGIM